MCRLAADHPDQQCVDDTINMVVVSVHFFHLMSFKRKLQMARRPICERNSQPSSEPYLRDTSSFGAKTKLVLTAHRHILVDNMSVYFELINICSTGHVTLDCVGRDSHTNAQTQLYTNNIHILNFCRLLFTYIYFKNQYSCTQLYTKQWGQFEANSVIYDVPLLIT